MTSIEFLTFVIKHNDEAPTNIKHVNKWLAITFGKQDQCGLIEKKAFSRP